MATSVLPRERAAALERGYRRLLVPLVGNDESSRAMEVACQLAAEQGASITALTVIEVPPLLPLDAYMDDEEQAARRLLDRAQATADAYGVSVKLARVRTRDAAATILEAVETRGVELVVLGAPRRRRARRLAPPFGRTVQLVLRRAGCRVLVVASPGG